MSAAHPFAVPRLSHSLVVATSVATLLAVGSTVVRAQSDAEVLSLGGDAACQYYFSKSSLTAERMSQRTVERRFQVGCVAGPGDGTIRDSKEFEAPTNWVIDKVEQLAPTNQPAGRCDPPPSLGTHLFDAVTNKVTLSTSCNYRSLGGSGSGPCAKCYQIRIVLKRKS